MLNKNNSIHTSIDNIHIYKEDYLLEPDNANTGDKPFRTYVGFKYNGGFSDHLPVFIDLFFNKD